MIKRREQIRWLNSQLLGEMPEYRPQAESFPNEHTAQRRLLRSLMNVRAPLPLRQGFLKAQDALPSAEREEKGVVDAAQLPAAPSDPCLALAAENDLESIAFRCISTGEFHFPNQEAAKIAVRTVREFLQRGTSVKRVIWNVFKDVDLEIYRNLFHRTMLT